MGDFGMGLGKKFMMKLSKGEEKLSSMKEKLFSASDNNNEVLLEFNRFIDLVDNGSIEEIRAVSEEVKLQVNNVIFQSTENINNVIFEMDGCLGNRKQLNADAEKLIEIANKDTLTGLMNRTSFNNIGNEFLKNFDNFTLINIDLNGLKQLNDNFSHEYGDLLLKLFSKYLLYFFNNDRNNRNAVFRTGGDEFIVLSTNENIDNILNSLSMFLENGIVLNGVVESSHFELNELLKILDIKKSDLNQVVKNISFSFGLSTKKDLEKPGESQKESEKIIFEGYKGNNPLEIDDSLGLSKLKLIADGRMYNYKKKHKEKIKKIA